MNREFTCSFADVIKEFINVKNAAGHPYEDATGVLHRFDRMITEKFPNAHTVTQEICDAWIAENPGESPNSLPKRITPVRQLAKYMNAIGIDAYIIPGNIGTKYIRYQAHIFTEQELKAFFRAIDGYRCSIHGPLLPYVIPAFFRMLFFCGMRSSEVRLLSVDDVDLDCGKITVRASKGWKARTLFMSQDLLETCQIYDEIISELCPKRTAFFPRTDGKYYERDAPRRWFHKFWSVLPESHRCVGNHPRVHDFRHTYATTRINEWVSEGKDLNGLYPYISEYMGHSSYVSTDYYLQMVPAFYPELNKKMAPVDELILPEVTCYEED